ncbi:hypothetical protein UA70_28265, partial [Raoultella planticola]
MKLNNYHFHPILITVGNAMRQIGKFLRDKPLKVLACTIIAGYSGQAFTADNGQDSTKEQTIVVTADAGAQGQGQDDESNIVAHSATAGSKSSQLISRTSQSIAVSGQAFTADNGQD